MPLFLIHLFHLQSQKFHFQKNSQKISTQISKDFEIFSIPTIQATWTEVLELQNSLTPSLEPASHNKLQKFIRKTISQLTGYAKKVLIEDPLPLNPSHEANPLNPVENVTYNQVIDWLKVANDLSGMNHPDVQRRLKEIFPGHHLGDVYRLPTNAEWEFVARRRGLDTGENSHDLTHFEVHQAAWYAENSQLKTQQVGLKKPFFINGQPIYDFFGNVNVWCSDWYGDVQGGVDPQGPEVSDLGKTVKGNSYFNLIDDFYPGFLTNQVKFQNPENATPYVGFRIVRIQKNP